MIKTKFKNSHSKGKNKNSTLKLKENSGKIQKASEKEINKNKGSIIFGQWIELSMPTEIMKVQKWNSEQLDLYKNQYSLLLKQISQITFPNLTRISLTANNIESVESLARLRAPKLKILWLGTNKVRELKSLRKIESKQIESITIRRNPIVELQALNQCNSFNLKTLCISAFEGDPAIPGSVNFLTKINTMKFHKLENASVKKIDQEKVQQILMSCYKSKLDTQMNQVQPKN